MLYSFFDRSGNFNWSVIADPSGFIKEGLFGEATGFLQSARGLLKAQWGFVEA